MAHCEFTIRAQATGRRTSHSRRHVRRHRWMPHGEVLLTWFLALGLLMLAVGIAAVIFPFTAALAITTSIGLVLIVAGIARFAHVFSVRK